jgi:hypothetical protein
MNIFDFINCILFSKKKIELNCDDESQFNSFMLNRWSSFYSKEIANFINETTNRYASIYSTKQEQFNLFINLLPMVKFKRINYIKKSKIDKENEEINKPEFMSLREYNQNVEFLKLISK